MPLINVEVGGAVSTSGRARQVSSMFDVPPQKRHKLTWKIDAPWESKPWNVGLIVGPSGAGKTTIMRHVFGDSTGVEWTGASVIDDFDSRHSVEDIADACSAVGFNTIPAWLRPFGVLSNGEQFRVTLARLLLDTSPDETIVIDEFTSVVDRQVAKIGSNAVQKWVRKNNRQFVGVTCHYDVIDWLQPDWVLDPARGTFEWRSVQPRPKIEVDIQRVSYEYWHLFAPYHYLTNELNHSARCFVAFVDGAPTAFAGVLHRPHPVAKNIKGLSRLVTLPDWQGLGLAFVLSDTVGACYAATGSRFHTYPAHPALIRSYDKSPRYALRQRPGFSGRSGRTTSRTAIPGWSLGNRPCAVFEYVGPAWPDREQAHKLLTS